MQVAVVGVSCVLKIVPEASVVLISAETVRITVVVGLVLGFAGVVHPLHVMAGFANVYDARVPSPPLAADRSCVPVVDHVFFDAHPRVVGSVF